MRRTVLLVLFLTVAVAATAWFCLRRIPMRVAVSHTPLNSETYVWQRVHSAAVAEAIATHGPDFSRIVVLAAQITWHGEKPSVSYIDLDYPSLAAPGPHGTRIGLAIRITEFNGSFVGASGNVVSTLAAHLLNEASSHFAVSEIQLDFDCPTRRLDDYRLWVDTVRQRVSCPVTITALPTWLDSGAFGQLARGTDGFVLQVHSLDRPPSIAQPATLCDIGKARAAISSAGRLNIPYRVALPTYGYTAAFDSSDHFIGLSAEGPSPDWPDGVHTREIRADATEIAQLVRDLKAVHPVPLTGLVYYRLPIATDRLNWSYPTLAAVMLGQTPAPELKVALRHPQPELTDIVLCNTGDADAIGPAAVRITRTSGQVLASDAGNGFDVTQSADGEWTWQGGRSLRIPPRAELVIGWIRGSSDAQFNAVILKEP